MFSKPKFRISILFLAPIVISCIFMSSSVVVMSENQLVDQTRHSSEILTSYLAMTSSQFVVNNDSLGINVLLNRMLNDSMLDFASVYDSNNQLIAQVGVRHNKGTVISQQITFQDTAAGYVQVGYSTQDSDAFATQLLATVLGFHALLAALVLFFILFAADFFAVWILPAQQKALDVEDATIDEPLTPQDEAHASLLVLKVVPARLAKTHRDILVSAVGLYGGRLVEPQSEDLLIQFRQKDAAFSAVCSGLLALTIIKQIGPPLKLKVGIHWKAEIENDQDEEKATKHASYLASIGEQVVLISKSFQQMLEESSDIIATPYHSSLAPDGEVFEISTVKNQALIDSQATQLLSDR